MEEQLSGRAIKRRRAEWKAQARREWEPQQCLDAVMAIYAESGKPISVRDKAKIARLQKALEKQPKKSAPKPEPSEPAPSVPVAVSVAETSAAVVDADACRWCGASPHGSAGKKGVCGSHFRKTRDDGTEYFTSGLFDCDDMLRLIEKNIPRWAEEDAKKAAAEVQQ